MQVDIQTLLILGALGVVLVAVIVAMTGSARARAEQAARLQQLAEISQNLANAQTSLAGRMEQAQADSNQRLDSLSTDVGAEDL